MASKIPSKAYKFYHPKFEYLTVFFPRLVVLLYDIGSHNFYLDFYNHYVFFYDILRIVFYLLKRDSNNIKPLCTLYMIHFTF